VYAHYRHTQVGWVILVVLGAIIALMAIQLAGSDAPAGWLPFAILVAVVLLFGTLRVQVDRDRIETVFGIGLIRRSVRLADVAAYRPVRNPWIAGWGIRLIPGGTLWNVSGLQAIELALRNGRYFRIGTDEPEALARAIERASGRPPAETRAGAAAAAPSRVGRHVTYALLALALIGGVVALVVVPMQQEPILVTVRAEGFEVESLFYGQSYPQDAIASFEVVPRLPRIEARTNGFAGGGLLRGDFRVSGLGDGKLFVDSRQPPYVLVRLREGFVILGLEDAAKTQALYDEMARTWPDKVAPPR
jgi:hypothetical protein